MGDEHQGRIAAAFQRKHQIDDAFPRGFIEIAGRLVCDKNGGRWRQRPGERDALLLAAGKLRRIMRKAGAKPDAFQFRRGPVEGIFDTGEFERDRDILDRRHRRDQMEGLEDDADPRAAKPRQLIFIEPGEIGAIDRDLAAIRPFQSGNRHEQCGFAGAGGADEADRLATPYIQRNALQNMNTRSPPAEA